MVADSALGPRDSLLASTLIQRHHDRVPQQLQAALEVELFLDAVAVGVHGLGAEVELLGDLPDAQAQAEHSEDHQLPVGQSGKGRAFGGGAARGGTLEEARAEADAEPNLA